MGTDLLALGLASASDTRVVEVSRGAVTRSGAILRGALFTDGRPALVVADERTWTAAGEAVQASLVAAGVPVVEPLIFPGHPVLYAALENSAVIRERLHGTGALGVAVGSGTINDLVKLAAGELGQPYAVVGPAASILRTKGSRGILDELALDEVPTFVIHGDRDLIVPFATARSAAKRSNGTLVTVKKGGHSWLLRDPETLPAIVGELLRGRLGDAIRDRIGAAGAESRDELESIFYEPDAPILGLTPPTGVVPTGEVHHLPKYRWTIS